MILGNMAFQSLFKQSDFLQVLNVWAPNIEFLWNEMPFLLLSDWHYSKKDRKSNYENH